MSVGGHGRDTELQSELHSLNLCGTHLLERGAKYHLPVWVQTLNVWLSEMILDYRVNLIDSSLLYPCKLIVVTKTGWVTPLVQAVLT